jgi:hypothetical protein
MSLTLRLCQRKGLTAQATDSAGVYSAVGHTTDLGGGSARLSPAISG